MSYEFIDLAEALIADLRTAYFPDRPRHPNGIEVSTLAAGVTMLHLKLNEMQLPCDLDALCFIRQLVEEVNRLRQLLGFCTNPPTGLQQARVPLDVCIPIKIINGLQFAVDGLRKLGENTDKRRGHSLRSGEKSLSAELVDVIAWNVLRKHHGYSEGKIENYDPVESRKISEALVEYSHRSIKDADTYVSKFFKRHFQKLYKSQIGPREAYVGACEVKTLLLQYCLKASGEELAFTTGRKRDAAEILALHERQAEPIRDES